MGYSYQIGISKKIKTDKSNMLDYDNCTGCMACLNVCPKNAITCVENENGFIVPSINNDLCINCGLCDKTCVLNKEITEESTIQNTLALVSENTDVLKKSTSGGAFTALSDVVLKKHGIIVGAIMDESFSICHVLTTETSIRDKMRGSKYVQSNVKDLYRKIKEYLESNVYVLFIGTPCQVHALRIFLRKDYDTLYAVDILCHGVPSNRMFKEHISYVNSVENSMIVDYHFRTKRFGRRNSIQEYKLGNSNKFITSFEAQEYASFFRQSLSIRPSCRICRYRSTHRFGDLTIGDYWGNAEPLKTGKAGVSLVCVNTPKGQSLIDSSDNIKFINVNTEENTRRPEFNAPRFVNQKRYDEFWNDYRKSGYQNLISKYYRVSFIKKLRFHFKVFIGNIMSRNFQ